MLKTVGYKVRGINQDLGASVFSSEMAYDILNMRITPLDDNSMFSLVNEKGTKLIESQSNNIEGTPIGICVINDIVVIFSCTESFSYIYKILIKGDTATTTLLYKGDLNFKEENPIETIGLYENENSIKVYWTDGENELRVINLAETKLSLYEDTNTYFNFVPDVQQICKIDVERIENSISYFHSGVIQYAVSYYRKYLQESNLITTSSLYYSTHSDRGGSPEDRITNSFKIKISDIDNTFTHLRLYSIFRTSLNATPVCKVVKDIKISDIRTQSLKTDTTQGQPTDNTYSYSGAPLSAWKVVVGETEYSLIKGLLGEGVNNDESLPENTIWSYSDIVQLFKDNLGINIYNNNSPSSPPIKCIYIEYDNNGGEYKQHAPRYYLNMRNDDPYYDPLVKNKNRELSETIPAEPKWKVLTTYKNVPYTWTGAFSIGYNKSNNSDKNKFTIQNTCVLQSIDLEDNTVYYSRSCIDYSERKSIIEVECIDDNSEGYIIDPSELLYKNESSFSAKTISHKDNTLFLGNVTDLSYSKYEDALKAINDAKDYIKIRTTTQLLNNAVPFNSPDVYTSNFNLGSLSEISYFKKGECYRLAIQLQDNKSKFTEPIYIGECKMTKDYIQTDYYDNLTVFKPEVVLPSSLISKLKECGYIGIRPLVCYPDLKERVSIIQGALCPTVYNYVDRIENTCYAQSSWFTRPFPPFVGMPLQYSSSNSSEVTSIQFYKLETYKNGQMKFEDETFKNYHNKPDRKKVLNIPDPLENQSAHSKYSVWGAMANQMVEDYTYDKATSKVTYLPIANVFKDRKSTGIGVQYQHYQLLGEATTEIGEISSNQSWSYGPEYNSLMEPTATGSSNNLYTDYFGVDQNFLTLHSPDLIYDESTQALDYSKFKLRIVGEIPITSNYGDIDIQTSTPFKDLNGAGTITQKVINTNPLHAYRTLASGFYNVDNIDLRTNWIYYKVFPFQHKGGLTASPNDTVYGELKYKKISNYKFSSNTIFEKFDLTYDCSDAQVFNSEEVTPIRLKAPKTWNIKDLTYNGNIDKVLVKKSKSQDFDSTINYKYIVSIQSYNEYPYNTQDGSEGDYILTPDNSDSTQAWKEIKTLNAPIEMKYKSTPHIALCLDDKISDGNNYITVLPELVPYISNNYTDGLTNFSNYDITFHNFINNRYNTKKNILVWEKAWPEEKRHKGVYHEFTKVRKTAYSLNPEYLTETGRKMVRTIYAGYLFLGELINPENEAKFKSTKPYYNDNIFDLKEKKWTIAGNTKNIKNYNTNSPCSLYWDIGDTFYQRFDCLKTYPNSLEEINGITDVFSFKCESRLNLQGRYDRNIGKLSHFATFPTNFNLYNPVYSQQNNFFTYRISQDKEDIITYFPNSIVWSNTKTIGENIDSWTKLILSSMLNLDGDKGEVIALRKTGNTLVSFQEKAIAQILYNENVQISSTQGVPIEIANSGKVQGKRYLTETIGSKNRLSIQETPNGIYFIDHNGKAIYAYRDKLDNLTNRLGMHSWINSLSDLDNIRTFYDSINNEIMFISDTMCLVYSEFMDCFTSFYSYGGAKYFFNINDKGYLISKSKINTEDPYYIWEKHGGEYNKFFDKNEDYYITLISNPDPQKDKVFDVLEFRADSYNDTTYKADYTFNRLKVWNEYQKGEVKLTYDKVQVSNLKKKFRIWRALIPRQGATLESPEFFKNRDRMRNPWLYIKLHYNQEEDEIMKNAKTILHDVIVTYSI